MTQQPTYKNNYTEPISPTCVFEMIFIKGRSFEMGSNDLTDWEKPPHPVTVPDFHLAQYPVTQALWETIMGSKPSYFKGANRPVESVSWFDAKKFIAKLNALPDIAKQNSLDEKAYALPTEAQWEYAARGGHQSKGYKHAGSNKLKEVGWFRENSHQETKPVGLKTPNECGLFDMCGNVWEWCEDDWHNDYRKAPDNGRAWVEKNRKAARRVVRGGSRSSYINSCLSADRSNYGPDVYNVSIGFRLARY